MMNRREVMQLGTGLLITGLGEGAAARQNDGDGYFLSEVNPIANRDQLTAEEQALRLRARPDVQAARHKVGFLFSLAYGADAPPEMRPSFEAAMDEYVFNYLLKATASDAEHPRVVRGFMAPYHWFGRDVPGARMGGDNPDNCYRLVGIGHAGRYRLTATPMGPEPASTTFTLVANYGTSKTVQTLDASQPVRKPDGSFEILIDADATAGQANHLRSTPDTKFLFIRDTLGDWQAEAPYALRVERLNPSGAPPIDDDRAARDAIDAMVDEVPLYYWFTRLNTGKPVNTLASPIPSGALGGLVNQAGTQGWFRLGDDEAMIVRVDPAGAAYCALSLVEWWYRSIDAETTISSLTNRQAALNPDGTITFVVSCRDPGARNWVETGGRREVLVINRWQGLPQRPAGEGPRVLEMRLVPFASVRMALGADALFISPEAREARRRERREAYARRFQL
jgi:hypothetical protein